MRKAKGSQRPARKTPKVKPTKKGRLYAAQGEPVESSGKSLSRQNEHKSKKDQPHSHGRNAELPHREFCAHCSNDLSAAERALFVEEEVGRIFCSEDCITAFFAPEIEKLENEYLKKLSPKDLSGDDREKLSNLRWPTLQNPEEVWREKTLLGDYRYTLISRFSPKGSKPLWCVCVCLFLRGEPSFLYIAFPTRNSAMVSHFRKGERVSLEALRASNSDDHSEPSRRNHNPSTAHTEFAESTDRLASSWNEGDLLQAELRQARKKDDIPREQFEKYLKYFEQTLETPDEVWSTALRISPNEPKTKKYRSPHLTSVAAESAGAGGQEGVEDSEALGSSYEPGYEDDTKRIYHFLKAYTEESPTLWYVIVARDTDEDEEIEILDSFPTHDETLVHKYRTGRQDVGEDTVAPAEAKRFLH